MSDNAPKSKDPVRDVNTDTDTGADKKIEDLYKLIEGIKFCMMTTRCASTGRLVSRCMSHCPPTHEAPADLWFFANNTTHKFDELEADPNVNLAFFKPTTMEWISVSGTAEIVSDRNKIRELYTPDLKPWFADLKDGTHDGGPDDPRISLIFVTAHTVHYSLKDVSAPMQIWNIARGIMYGEPPKVSAQREVDAEELQHARNLRDLDKTVLDA